MRYLMGLGALIFWICTAGASVGADGRPLVVVELFTSQGCSSCPPADEIFNGLALRQDVLALSFHVDYWDYIGWADTLALPENTTRQKAYSHAAGMQSIYTPQMIIAGTNHVIGSHPLEISDHISAFHNRPAQVSLVAHAGGGRFHLEAKSLTHTPLPNHISVIIVRFSAQENVDILRGENAGKSMSYINVVTEIKAIGQWDGSDVLALDGTLAGDGPAAVFLQVSGPGEILAAARLR